MTLEEVYQYYGSANQACKALGLTRQSFTAWNKRGYIPMLQQLRLEKLTNGKLCANESHAHKQEGAVEIHLPAYRYYDKKHGLCPVESLVFQPGKKAKVIYSVDAVRAKKISTFVTKYLMKAVDVKDSFGNYVFEGDVIAYNEGRDYFIFDTEKKVDELKSLGAIAIAGHIYDGVKYGS